MPTLAEASTSRGSEQTPVPDDESFIAADADSSIIVDADGIMLTLDGRGLPWDQIETDEDLDQDGARIELSWPEIADVTHGIVRRSRLHVTVTLHDGSAFESEISARRVSRVQQWHRELAEAVTRYLSR
ncbi:hypothetical protein ABZ686_18480 [Streptomyces sp. NPDC006992]|uniref:hypothetical protein n=1 Tax=unclassified Streptomyces TaxID=2593676 RepID=UPI00340F05C7